MRCKAYTLKRFTVSRLTSAWLFLPKLFVRSQPAPRRIVLWNAVQVVSCTAALVGSVHPVPHSCKLRRLHRLNLSQCTSSQSTQRNSTTRRNAGSGRDQISKGKNAKCVVNPWRLCHVAWRPSRLISSDQLALLGIHSQKNQALRPKRVIWINRDICSKSALSERPRINAINAAVLSMNQSPRLPRNLDGLENKA